ncbi:MAG: hypothetical protein SVW02_04355 [Candidatus Nanohaloarchaea archaeon]|nr:hypothetical protein [Candidatus Nanohaloarchaea archaeon]
MGGGKKIVAGVILGGAAVALRRIGDAIFTTTGTKQGAFLHYGALIELVSVGLLALASLLALYGVLEGLYTRWVGSGDEEEEEATNSRSRNAPSSRRDRPRNRQRS